MSNIVAPCKDGLIVSTITSYPAFDNNGNGCLEVSELEDMVEPAMVDVPLVPKHREGLKNHNPFVTLGPFLRAASLGQPAKQVADVFMELKPEERATYYKLSLSTIRQDFLNLLTEHYPQEALRLKASVAPHEQI